MSTVTIRPAEDGDLAAVAHLRWDWVTGPGGEPAVTRDVFVASFTQWARENASSHSCTVAVRGTRVIGMAWLAVVPRVPSPRALRRTTADVQSVYVVPDERHAGVGARLLEAVVVAAQDRGVERVTVHSSARAVPLYVRAGFASGPRLLDLHVDVADPGGASERGGRESDRRAGAPPRDVS